LINLSEIQANEMFSVIEGQSRNMVFVSEHHGPENISEVASIPGRTEEDPEKRASG
jgi:hypothetical protein